ncbi:hypothetical protein VPFG_00275 [Vibrio phage nt-1]|uniref:Uncharacterized protein n=1 Tax=Vibrio phage nt-1 TaxID=115992 RepID=R9TFL4_9CAUD|nr:hypothetical protein VPFG_00275 [Vibrio phage nt-1]AGN30274.1 hypothetical protein VPFG_00275 [Vibrio phage nt-1]
MVTKFLIVVLLSAWVINALITPFLAIGGMIFNFTFRTNIKFGNLVRTWQEFKYDWFWSFGYDDVDYFATWIFLDVIILGLAAGISAAAIQDISPMLAIVVVPFIIRFIIGFFKK